MAQNRTPIVALDAQGHAEVIGADIPEPTAYSGRGYIDLQLQFNGVADWFRHDVPAAPHSLVAAAPSGGAGLPAPGTPADDQILARIVGAAGVLRIVHNADGSTVFGSNLPMSAKLSQLMPADVLTLDPGRQVVLRRSMYGTLSYSVVSSAPSPAPLTALSAASSAPATPADVLDVAVPPETNPPMVSITWDSAGTDRSPKTFTSWPPMPVYGSAEPSDAQPTSQIKQLSLYLDTTVIRGATGIGFVGGTLVNILGDLSRTTWQWQASLAGLKPAPSSGAHTLLVAAWSRDGGVSYATLTFTLALSGSGGGTPAPSLTIASPAPAGVVTFTTLPMQLTVAGSASSSNAIQGIAVELDGASTTSTEAQPASGNNWGSWTASLSIASEGSHTISATCKDSTGAATTATVTFAAKLTPLTVVAELKQRLMLAESYRLSSFLGRYGAGQVVKTFTLLPGESTTISVSTFNKVETTSKSATSILDSMSDESATDFEDTLAAEQHHEEAQKETFNYHVDGQVSADWGWGSAQISAGVKGGTDSSRDEFGKTASSALQKHSTQATAKRDVNITSEYTAASDTEGQTKVERQIKNVNLSRVLNFVFRQMNQEFFTLLHLVDLRVAHYKEELMSDGSVATTYREAAIPELDALLQSVIADGTCLWPGPAPAGLGFHTGQIEKWRAAKQLILKECIYVADCTGSYRQFLELATGKDPLESSYAYWRVKPGTQQTYAGPAKGESFTVPGVIIRADSVVMRTEGIIVDALLGTGQALDGYSQGLQSAAVTQRDLANAQAQADIDKAQLGISIVKAKDQAAAKVYAKVYPPPEEEPEIELSATPDGSGSAAGAQPPGHPPPA